MLALDGASGNSSATREELNWLRKLYIITIRACQRHSEPKGAETALPARQSSGFPVRDRFQPAAGNLKFSRLEFLNLSAERHRVGVREPNMLGTLEYANR